MRRLQLPSLLIFLLAVGSSTIASAITLRDSMDASHHAPLLHLNETQILMTHDPDPESYWVHDFVSTSGKSWQGFIIAHSLGMSLAFWVLLPCVIALRIARNKWRGLVLVAFHAVVAFSTICAMLYNKLTPNLYTGSAHGSLGYVILPLTSILPLFDASTLLKKIYTALRNGERPSFSKLKNYLVSSGSHQPHHSVSGLAHFSQEPMDLESVALKAFNPDDEDSSEVHTTSTENNSHHHDRHRHVRIIPYDTDGYDSRRTTIDGGGSIHSDYTLHNSPSISRSHSWDSHHLDSRSHPASFWLRTGRYLFHVAERLLVILAFVQFLTGTVVYTGICRGNYLNGCLAHLIKGGIFWVYGLVTFARFLGAFADKGWAWNYLPGTKRKVSFEFVESLIIFIYGATNTWMERFGAAPGTPFTTKQVQHISIAVMFWFGGLVGMAIESRRFRLWLGSAGALTVKPGSEVVEPETYMSSFNPIPAIIIGITGAAMSAHHQTYLFQVQIHALWGYFLIGFAILRCFTYFFLWIRPPRSVLPSRPPTEAVASFLVACGGLTFMFSTEQVTFAAMRGGHDDVMMFLNVTVALTCLSFCWLVGLLSFKGWLSLRGKLAL